MCRKVFQFVDRIQIDNKMVIEQNPDERMQNKWTIISGKFSPPP